MAATDGQIILAASRFGDTSPLYLRDFSKQKLPAVAKIIKGQHQNLGVPTLSAPSLQSTALFLNAGKKYQILAQPIKIKEGRKPTNVGSKVLIPETYPGYFELLSEDGRSTRCIDTVLELSRRRNMRVLVRETFRSTQMNRTIHAGELLTTINDNGKYLQCKNIKDEIVNIPLDTKAKFSPIAKEDSISGVHTVKNLLLKRMPVIVRLVHGSAPKGMKQPFVPELRLLGCVEIDRVFALPLQKDTDLVPVPLTSKMKLYRAKNMEQLEHFIEYTRFLDKAQRLLSDARDRLQIVDLKLSEKEKKDSRFCSRNKLPVVMMPSAAGMASGLAESGYVLRKSASCDSWSKNQVVCSSEIAEEYNEIDHIYDYVRGLTPLSKGLTRFEPICESPTMKSHHTDSSNYCSLNRVNTHQNNNNNNNNSSTNNNNVNANNNNNNYSSLDSNKHTNTNSSHNSSSNHSNNHHHHHHQQQQQQQQQHQHHHHHQGHTHSTPQHQQPQSVVNHYHHSHIQEDIKPVPPPIETIPGKKLPEKRQRPTLPKLYIKNAQSAASSSNASHQSHQHQHQSHQHSHQSHQSHQHSHSHQAHQAHQHQHNLHGNTASSSSTAAAAAVANAAAAAVAAHHAHAHPHPHQHQHQHQHQHHAGTSGAGGVGGVGGKVLTPNNHLPLNGNLPHTAGILGKEGSLEPQSPLFHIRYKSLSSLQLTPESAGAIHPTATATSSNSNNNNNNTPPISINPKGQTATTPQDVVLKCSSILNSQHSHAYLAHSKSSSSNGGMGLGLGIGGLASGSQQQQQQQHHNPREGTLDSSRSGGRTSGDSNKLPEKKTRRLSRPRSLSNLVWDLRPTKEKSKKKLYVHHFDHRQQATLYL